MFVKYIFALKDHEQSWLFFIFYELSYLFF
ncbi:hypothetical protein EMIT091MI3_210069 [Kosakonia quasisacchari]